MEIVVALVLLAGCGIVISDSMRMGFGWRDGEGPAPGYYPFWVAVILGVSSLVNLVERTSRPRRRRNLRILAAVRPRAGGAGPEPDLRRAHRRALDRAVNRPRHLRGLGDLHIRFHDCRWTREPAQGDGRRRSSCRSPCSSCSRNGFWCPCRRVRSRRGWAIDRRSRFETPRPSDERRPPARSRAIAGSGPHYSAACPAARRARLALCMHPSNQHDQPIAAEDLHGPA